MKIRNIKNNKKGITLIALIITIILMLILAGVVLNLTIGENGLIKIGKKAGEEYKISAAKEKIELAVMDYEAKIRKETIYSIIDRIEGLESIEPEDENVGLPYTVTVDGYKFLVKEGIEVIYQGKANGIIPEIISITKNIISDTEAKINIEAKTKDSEGIEKLILMKNGVAIEEKEVRGKDIKEEFSATGNGKYKIKVIGKNKKRAISKEIEISEMNIGSAEIASGEIIEGKAQLTITGDYGKLNITKMEIYEGQNKIKEIAYKEAKSKIEEEYETDYMPFYEEKTYTAKIIADKNNETKTNELKLKNKDTIKTEKDLRTLASTVNEGENFETKIIKQIADINLIKEHTAIGTISAPFKGTYNGQEKTINNIQINSTTLENQGLFGYIENATLKNIILGEGNINAGNKLGGAVGYAKDSTIENITNNKTNITANSTYYENYGTALNDFGTIIVQTNSFSANTIGGICGLAKNTNIQNCHNDVNVAGTNSGWLIGGIVGYMNGENIKLLNCTNAGNVTNGWAIGGIVGLTYDYVQIEKCKNNGIIKTSRFGTWRNCWSLYRRKSYRM